MYDLTSVTLLPGYTCCCVNAPKLNKASLNVEQNHRVVQAVLRPPCLCVSHRSPPSRKPWPNGHTTLPYCSTESSGVLVYNRDSSI
jgi:hypothetical protein